MKMKIMTIILIFFSINCYSQNSSQDEQINLDFRNQKITDIIYSISDLCGKSVYIDDTVTGYMSFHFEDSSFEKALNRFAEYAELYIEKKDNVYYISKIHFEMKNDLITLNAEDVLIEPLVVILSRKANRTIIYDKLPEVKITLRCTQSKIEEILNLILIKLNGFTLEKVGEGFYISKNTSSNAKRNIDSYVLSKNKNSNGEVNYSLKLQKASFNNLIDDLFKREEKEYSLVNIKPFVLESLYLENKDFNTMLNLILESSNCDYTLSDGIYYIYEINKKNLTKKLKETKIIKLENISVDNFLSIAPNELGISEYIKVNKYSNSLILTGSSNEILPIENFIKQIDVPLEGRYYKKFSLNYINVKDALTVIPKTLLLSDVVILSDGTSFITQVTEQKEKEILDYLAIIDKSEKPYPIKLKYIKSEELLKNIPPIIKKENIFETGDSSLIFFVGSESLYNSFLHDLELIDKPKQQIRYQILVIQHQKTSGLNYNSGLTNVSSVNESESPSITHSTVLSKLLNINFDIVSKFGIQFAATLNAELSNGMSHVLADTTLNGISGESITFSNTNIFRYRDIIRDNNEVYTSTAREISSGLVLSINGWVSGDDMITVEVDAAVSKQGSVESSGSADVQNPPSTSEKKVKTYVRTKSGTPVIIGGLLQEEKDITVKKVPVLGHIPLIGLLFRSKVKSVSQTELVIYLVPFVEKTGNVEIDYEKNIERFYLKYVDRDE